MEETSRSKRKSRFHNLNNLLDWICPVPGQSAGLVLFNSLVNLMHRLRFELGLIWLLTF